MGIKRVNIKGILREIQKLNLEANNDTPSDMGK